MFEVFELDFIILLFAPLILTGCMIAPLKRFIYRNRNVKNILDEFVADEIVVYTWMLTFFSWAIIALIIYGKYMN